MGAANHLLRYLDGLTDFPINCKQGGVILAAFSYAHWGSNLDYSQSTSSSIVVANGRISFKMGRQGLTSQSTMETELVAAALTMKRGRLVQEHDRGAKVQGFPSIYKQHSWLFVWQAIAPIPLAQSTLR